MASKMVERVAIVLNDEVFKAKGQSIIEWKDTPDNIKERVRYVAKCTIEAMREPTEEMIRESTECCGDHVAAYQAMIDKALEE